MEETTKKPRKHTHQFEFLFNETETDQRYAKVFIMCKCGEVHRLRFEGDRIFRAINKFEE